MTLPGGRGIIRPMKVLSVACAVALVAAPAAPAAAATRGQDALLREVLRQQSAAERSVCDAIGKAVAAGIPAAEVVTAAVGLGHAPCGVVRCALAAGAELPPVLEAAASAGAPPEVLSRCAVEGGAAPSAVAAVLNGLSAEPSLCYFDPELRGAPVVPPYGDRDRQYARPELSPFLP